MGNFNPGWDPASEAVIWERINSLWDSEKPIIVKGGDNFQVWCKDNSAIILNVGPTFYPPSRHLTADYLLAR